MRDLCFFKIYPLCLEFVKREILRMMLIRRKSLMPQKKTMNRPFCCQNWPFLKRKLRCVRRSPPATPPYLRHCEPKATRQSSPPHIEPHNTSVYAQYTILVNGGETLQAKLTAAGIPTAVHYPIPLNKQPAVADQAAILPVGDEVAQQVISLPMGPYLQSTDQVAIANLLGNGPLQ